MSQVTEEEPFNPWPHGISQGEEAGNRGICRLNGALEDLEFGKQVAH